jgi:peroxiredoxin Q/BCP
VEGSRAPEITAIDQNGVVVSLRDHYAKGLVLVYFFFRSGTPVCTVHACRLRDGLLQLRERNVEIFGVSTESPERLKKFETRHRLPFRLLADSDGRIANAFGVNSFLGLPARRAFLVVDGLVSWEGHASEAAAKVINGFR